MRVASVSEAYVRDTEKKKQDSYRSCLRKTPFAFFSTVLLNLTFTAFN